MNDDKEPTTREQQKRHEKFLDKKPIRTKIMAFREPRALCSFILQYASDFAWLSGHTIKKKLPDIRTSAKRINEMQDTDEYYNEWRKEIPDINKQRRLAIYDMLQYKYLECQMNLPRGPDYTALVHFGVSAGKIDPRNKMMIYDGDKADTEQEKARTEAIVDALENRFKRERREQREAKKKEGDVDGK